MQPASEIFINYSIPKNVQVNIKKLLTNHPEGVWGSDFEKEYRKSFNEDLNLKEYGCTSIKHMCSSIKYLCQIANSMKDFKIFSINTTIPDNWLENNKKNYELSSTIVQLGSTIQRDQLPAANDFKIKIIQVHDPSKFWFFTDANERKLTKLMKDLQCFYNSGPGEYYKVSPYDLKVGLYCSTIYYGQFHRAVIVDMVPELFNSVKVYYIDYGTVDLADTTYIYYLHQSFAKLKAVAFRGRLANVKPKGLNMPWASSVSCFFETAVQNKAMDAKVISTVKEDNAYVYTLKLFDPTIENMFWIHERLKAFNDLVIAENREQHVSESIPEIANNTCMLHLVPSFDELENGKAPNMETLSCLEEFDLLMKFAYEPYLKK